VRSWHEQLPRVIGIGPQWDGMSQINTNATAVATTTVMSAMCVVCVQPVWFGSDVNKYCSWKKFGLEDLQLYVCHEYLLIVRLIDWRVHCRLCAEISWQLLET